jgi:glycosyltransferase involved in cell wall biosynthesis
MKISIITSTLNCREDLEVTIKSVTKQINENIEWIVIDGGSTDGTLEIIQKAYNDGIITKYISEFDRGIFSAWNKSLKILRGEWVIFVGAGDYFPSENTVDKILNVIDNSSNFNIISGVLNLIHFKTADIVSEKTFDKLKYKYGMPNIPPHPSTLIRSDLFRKFPFDENLKIAADTEQLIKIISENNVLLTNTPILSMKLGGVSTNPANALRVYKENLIVANKLQLKIPFNIKILYFSKAVVFTFIFKLLGFKLGLKFVDLIRVVFGRRKYWT